MRERVSKLSLIIVAGLLLLFSAQGAQASAYLSIKEDMVPLFDFRNVTDLKKVDEQLRFLRGERGCDWFTLSYLEEMYIEDKRKLPAFACVAIFDIGESSLTYEGIQDVLNDYGGRGVFYVNPDLDEGVRGEIFRGGNEITENELTEDFLTYSFNMVDMSQIDIESLDNLFYDGWWEFEEGYTVDFNSVINLSDDEDKVEIMHTRSQISSEFIVPEDGFYRVFVYGVSAHSVDDLNYTRIDDVRVELDRHYMVVHPDRKGDCENYNEYRYCEYFVEKYLESGVHRISIESLHGKIGVDRFSVYKRMS